MRPWWTTLLQDQRASRFEALSGTRAAVTLPISDRLISDVVNRQLPDAIRELDIKALAGDQLSVGVRLRNPSWLPTITVKLGIEEQASLPDAPVLGLRLLSHGALAAFAGPASKFLGNLPAWIQMDGDRIRLDLAELAREHDAADALRYVRVLNVTTRQGIVVLTLDAHIP